MALSFSRNAMLPILFVILLLSVITHFLAYSSPYVLFDNVFIYI